MAQILVIQGHPDRDPERLCRALADAYCTGARSASHTVVQVDLAALDVPLLGSRAEYETGTVPQALVASGEALRAADHVVLVFPLWLGTMPALVKAFLEQVMRPGIAFEYRDRGMPRKLLKGKTARIVVTMGMPAAVYRWWFRAHGVRAIERNILKFVGFAAVRTLYLGGVEGASMARRERWLKRMRKLGGRAA